MSDELKGCREAFEEWWEEHTGSVEWNTGLPVALAAWRAAWNRREGEEPVSAEALAAFQSDEYTPEEKLRKLMETFRNYDKEILILRGELDDARAEHHPGIDPADYGKLAAAYHHLRAEIKRVRDECESRIKELEQRVWPISGRAQAKRSALLVVYKDLTRILDETEGL